MCSLRFSNQLLFSVSSSFSHFTTHAHTLGKKDILINACCPGWVRTDMAGPKAPLSPEEGAETPVMLALLPPAAGSPSGEFWKDKKVVQ